MSRTKRTSASTASVATTVTVAASNPLPSPVVIGGVSLKNFTNRVDRLGGGYRVNSSFDSIPNCWNYGFYYYLNTFNTLQDIANANLSGSGIAVLNASGKYDFYYGGFGSPMAYPTPTPTGYSYPTASGYVSGVVLTLNVLTSIRYIIGCAIGGTVAYTGELVANV